MKIESCTTPKYRDLSQPGDDILVVLPQFLYTVFDGATDTAGVSVHGESPGRPWWRMPVTACFEHTWATGCEP